MVCKAVSDSKKFRFVECGADNLHAYGHIVRHTHGNCKTGKSRKVQRKGENIHLVHLTSMRIRRALLRSGEAGSLTAAYKERVFPMNLRVKTMRTIRIRNISLRMNTAMF